VVTLVTQVCLLIAGAGRGVPVEADPLTLLAATLSLAPGAPCATDVQMSPGLGGGALPVGQECYESKQVPICCRDTG